MTFQLDSTLKSDSIILGSFELNLLLLMNDSQYPWFTLVPKRSNKVEIYQLSEDDRQLLWLESDILSRVIMDVFDGEKLNIGAIGNVVSQLHVHHVVRFQNDVSWPKPIWGQRPMIRYNHAEQSNVVNKIVPKLGLFGFSN